MKDWRFFSAVTADQDNLWNKKTVQRPISVRCNEHPHLEEWAQKMEKERRQMEIDAENEHYKQRRKNIDKIRKKDRDNRARAEAV